VYQGMPASADGSLALCSSARFVLTRRHAGRSPTAEESAATKTSAAAPGTAMGEAARAVMAIAVEGEARELTTASRRCAQSRSCYT